MLISIKEKPYIVEKKLEKMNSIRYKGKLYQIEKKKDKWIIKMTRGGGRYNNTFKWEINVENEKLDIKMKNQMSFSFLYLTFHFQHLSPI